MGDREAGDDGEQRAVPGWRPRRPLTESHAVLWAVIVVASAFDVVTTMTGLNYGLREANPVARAFVETYGTPGIGMLKFGALVVAILSWAVLSDRYATRVLTAFALVGLLTVVLNALTLASL